MRKALVVARWEFLTTVKRRSYIFAVVAMPLMFLGFGALTTLSVPAALGTANTTPTAIVDKAGIVDLEFASAQVATREKLRSASGNPSQNPPPRLVSYPDEDSARQALTESRVTAVYVIEADYLANGTLTAYARSTSVMNQGPANQRQGAVADAIRSSLLKRGLEGDAIVRAYAPAANLKLVTVASDGQLSDGSDAFSLGRFAGTFGVFILFTMAIFFSAGFLQQATIEDRQNRMFEILLSSIDADDLLIGKIMGLGGAGLLQVGLYVLLIIIPGSSVLAMFQVPLGKVLFLVVYFVIGYLLFACLMAGVGMISRTPQEGAQLSAIWTLTASAPMFVMPALIASPNGMLARGLSMFPLTSPITMMFRLTMTPDVPILDIVLSISLGIAAVYLGLKGTAKIFRAATLMYGKRPTLPELLRWLRA
jgi:ABC-2 type transport system permease protein